MFGHEKLKAYPKAIEFVAITSTIIELTPRGNGKLLDQLQRAAISVPLNIAEGSGRTTEIDKKRFYAIARGSAMECVAILDVLLQMKFIEKELYDSGREKLKAVVGILTSICR